MSEPTGPEQFAITRLQNLAKKWPKSLTLASMGGSLISFTCELCEWTSRNPNDAQNGFCGRCHQYVHGVVCRDVPTMPDRRHIEHTDIEHTDCEVAAIVYADGAVAVVQTHVKPQEVSALILVLKVAQRESRRRHKP